MKKSLKQVLTTVGIAAIALVTLSACGNTGLDSGKSSDTKVEKKAAKDIKVGVSLSTLSNPFFVSVRNGVENLADKKIPRFKYLMHKTIQQSRIMMLKI